MDIASFSCEDFDTKAWINDILKNAENQKESSYTMSLVMKLQLYVQQVNNALEDTSQEALTSLPKIMRDSKILQQNASLLKEKMVVVRAEIEKIEHETGKSIETIAKFDSMKGKLILAKQGLHESDNWTVLVNDLEEVFDSRNIEHISNKIFGMQNSLKLLVNVSDYDDRKLQLEGLKNRLEAIASPAIVKALNSYNTGNPWKTSSKHNSKISQNQKDSSLETILLKTIIKILKYAASRTQNCRKIRFELIRGKEGWSTTGIVLRRRIGLTSTNPKIGVNVSKPFQHKDHDPSK
ncbi:hypothetical protein JTB14_026604 [Gonioctena quinquepunctata]|nr:hypothetical protein JTB14_026604 [Gonioctena quinquepunctata]